eukprot:10466371-Ditylum_brightwellii.AAC.1
MAKSYDQDNVIKLGIKDGIKLGSNDGIELSIPKNNWQLGLAIVTAVAAHCWMKLSIYIINNKLAGLGAWEKEMSCCMRLAPKHHHCHHLLLH